MAYPRTGSILDSTTHTALSTQIIIMVNNEPIGAAQELSIEQRRQLKRIKEIGTDGTIEIVPTSSADISVSMRRIAFDGLSMTESMSRGFRNINSQRIPFDIVMIDQYTGTGDDAVITTLHGCWFSSLSVSYSAEDYLIAEQGNIEVEYMSIIRGGEAVAKSQGVGGGRQIPGIQLDVAELEADSGLRRGALDYPGLISAAY